MVGEVFTRQVLRTTVNLEAVFAKRGGVYSRSCRLEEAATRTRAGQRAIGLGLEKEKERARERQPQ